MPGGSFDPTDTRRADDAQRRSHPPAGGLLPWGQRLSVAPVEALRLPGATAGAGSEQAGDRRLDGEHLMVWGASGVHPSDLKGVPTFAYGLLLRDAELGRLYFYVK